MATNMDLTSKDGKGGDTYTIDTPQATLALHALACIKVHDEILVRAQDTGEKTWTFREMAAVDPVLSNKNNLCAMELMCAFGRQAIKPFTDVVKSHYGEMGTGAELDAMIERQVDSIATAFVRVLQ